MARQVLDPPEGPRRILDLIAKVPTRQAAGAAGQWLALIHIEIESPDKVAPLRPRMFETYVHLRRQHKLPVLPIGVFLRVGLNGIGIDAYEESFWELRPVRFEYLYVGLPALDGVEYVQGENWLGVALAALMKIPPERVAWLGAEALRRIESAPLADQQRFLLGECVQAYLPLDEQQQRDFERLIASEPYQRVQTMNTTWYEKGIEEGIEKGERNLLRQMLKDRFGQVSPEAMAKFDSLSAKGLEELRKSLLRAGSLQELGLED